MTTPAQAELSARTHLALGRFVVAFSGLLHALEISTVHLVAPAPDGRRMSIVMAALADRTAAPIVASFFSVFFKYWEGQLTQDDIKILKCLRSELDEIVRERNRLMHDVWMTSYVGGDPGPHELIRHRVRAHGAGVEFESKSYSPERLTDLADDAQRLAAVVSGAVWYYRPGQPGPELDTRMRIVDGRVRREP